MLPRHDRMTQRLVFVLAAALCALPLVPGFAMASTPAVERGAVLASGPALRAAAISGPAIAPLPPVVEFGTVTIGQASSRALTVSNSGDQTLSLTSVTITDPHFTSSFSGPITILAGSQVNLQLRYTPTEATFDAGTLTIGSNAVNGPAVVSLTGTGTVGSGSLLGAGRMLLAPGGEADGDQFGISAASAGDVNGDGLDDVIVGAWTNDAGGQDAGRAYLYLGGANPGSEPALVFQGKNAGDNFGVSVASAGDVNGDGFADMIVGAWRNDAAGLDAGRAYLFFGGPGADAIADRVYTGQVAGDRFGVSVSSAGDVNGDGFDDVIVGAFLSDAGGTDAGRAYVYFGGPASDQVADWVLTGDAPLDDFAWSVSRAGDVNGDGFDDVIVGAYANDAGAIDAGRAYVFYGGIAPDASPDWVLTGEAGGDRFGVHVASAGDVNGDGFADLIVGADMSDVGGTNAGRAYLFFGGPAADTTPDLTLTGDRASAGFGGAVAAAGDVNADGFSDFIVGAWLDGAGGVAAGRAYHYYGGPAMSGTPDQVYTGEEPGDRLGNSVASAGDVDGDGHADIVLGAYFNDAFWADGGRAYVISPTVTFAPIVTAPATISGVPGAPILFEVTAADPQGGAILSFTASPLPEGATFTTSPSNTSGTFAWTPTQEGTVVVTFTASNGVSGTARTTITVALSNHPPVISAPAGVFAAEGVLISFDVRATDPDGGHVALGVLDRPVGSLFVDDGNNSGRFNWTPGFGQAGTYTVTFTGRDDGGADAVPIHVSIAVDNVNRGPTAAAGGPYAGVVGVAIEFDGTRSSDPDGDALSYAWDFGDGQEGAGPIPNHVYAAGGAFVVSLTASDGSLTGSAMTSATVQDVFPARAFVDAGNSTTRLNSGKATTCIQIEPSERSYLNSSVDVSSIVMISPGTGSVDRISAISDKVTIGGDWDRNGIDEIEACFSKADLRLLFASLSGGRHTVAVTLEGALTTGGRFRATLEMTVVASGNAPEALVAPNPLNPSGTLTFHVMREGPVTVVLFDPAGRRVRTLLDGARLPAGYHDVIIDGRGDNGLRLASGIYFYRVATGEGIATGRFAVLK
ncbi:MAG TPA: PKD domain-containing protein [Candidatus Eisenbacteria bacterium]